MSQKKQPTDQPKDVCWSRSVVGGGVQMGEGQMQGVGGFLSLLEGARTNSQHSKDPLLVTPAY